MCKIKGDAYMSLHKYHGKCHVNAIFDAVKAGKKEEFFHRFPDEYYDSIKETITTLRQRHKDHLDRIKKVVKLAQYSCENGSKKEHALFGKKHLKERAAQAVYFMLMNNQSEENVNKKVW
eukprot:UN27122